jgi:hypothetical protein
MGNAMRLTDLNPHWFTEGDSPDIVGITFDCPCCAGKSRLGVLFQEPIDRDGLPTDVHWTEHKTLWHREGDSFETLSLTPSIDCSKWGHWHGFITAGEVR